MWQYRVIVTCSLWIAYFALPGPREIYDFFFGSAFPRNPQYLFAGNNDREVCRRLRRVVENGKANIYIENLSTHKLHIVLTQRQIRALVAACTPPS